MRTPAARLWTLWPAFFAVHLWLAWLCLFGPGEPFGDVENFYRFWADQALTAGHPLPGITQTWVYPVLGLPFVLAPRLFGDHAYGLAWLVLAAAADAAAFAVLIARRAGATGRRRVGAAWWWLLALVALGPVAVARLDTLSLAAALVAVVVLSTRPVLAGALLAVGAWIKVWPAALVLAALVALRSRWRVLAGALAVTAAVALVTAALGGASELLGFVTAQTGRGLQIESVFATPWLWQAAHGSHTVSLYYDTGIWTYQLKGPGVDAASAVSTWVMLAALAASAVLGLRALGSRAEPLALAAVLGLASTAAFIAFDKVGSPQYQSWYVAPVVLGLLAAGRRFATPAVLVVVLAVLTQVIYPDHYDALVLARPWMVGWITVRNVLELVLFAWALGALWRLGSRGSRGSRKPAGHRRSPRTIRGRTS